MVIRPARGPIFSITEASIQQQLHNRLLPVHSEQRLREGEGQYACATGLSGRAPLLCEPLRGSTITLKGVIVSPCVRRQPPLTHSRAGLYEEQMETHNAFPLRPHIALPKPLLIDKAR